MPELSFLSEWTTLDPRIPDYEISIKLGLTYDVIKFSFITEKWSNDVIS